MNWRILKDKTISRHLSLPLACKPEWKAYSEVLPSHSNYNLLHRLNRPFASNDINGKLIRTRKSYTLQTIGSCFWRQNNKHIIKPIHGVRKQKGKISLKLVMIFDIWWLLKEPFVLAVNPQSEFTCCWCTWSQPWFLHWQRVWPVHRAEAAWWRSGSRENWWLISCCSGQGGKLGQH